MAKLDTIIMGSAGVPNVNWLNTSLEFTAMIAWHRPALISAYCPHPLPGVDESSAGLDP
jgi:hypothetical protein